MNMHSDSYSEILRTLTLWIGILFIGFILFSSVVIPANAAGTNGWIEARVTVPEGFDEHIIVCIVNQDTGEEYATRLMEVNDYVSFFEVPEGNYSFDCAFLENSDFRYNTDLTNGAETFVVSGGNNSSAALLTFNTTFNEAFKDGATLVPPTVETTVTEPSETVSDSQALNPQYTGSGKNTNIITTETTEQMQSSSEASGPVEEATSDTQPEFTVSAEEIVASKENSELFIKASEFSQNVSASDDLEMNDETDNQESDASDNQEDEQEEQTLPLWKRILYTALATGIFIAIVFGCAYLYRRHFD